MKRISIHLEELTLERLAQHSKNTGIPQAEIVRRALEERLNQMDEEAFRRSEAEYHTSSTQTR